ncbi:MAG: NAD-dependent epimerase/dehydratase [Actinomycetota bacterium]|nr:NAD-dependent epimerase/dehydratase [Actinomycetota bacterium]
MERALVLGAAGSIGSQVRRALEASTHVRARYVARQRPPSDALERSWIPLDLATASVAELSALLQRVEPDVVVNCTGLTTGSPAQLWPVNVGIVDKLIRALTSSSRRIRLIQLGSSAEYGQHEAGTPIGEGDECRPTGPYGQSKLIATEMIVDAVARDDLEASVLRVFNAIGPGIGTHTLAGHAAHALHLALAEHLGVVEFGPLDTYRDFVDVRDIARAVAMALDSKRALPPVLNIGSGSAVMSRAVVLVLSAIAGYMGEIVETRRHSLRSADVAWQQADTRLVHSALRWEPRIALRESLSDLWRLELRSGGTDRDLDHNAV